MEPVVELAYSTVSVPLAVPVRTGALVVAAREYCCVRADLAGGAQGEAFVLTRGLDVAGAVRDLIAPRALAGLLPPPTPDPSGDAGGGPDGGAGGGTGSGAGDPLRVSLRNIGWDGPVSRAAAAVSLAVLDAHARAAGVPVWRLLGGREPRPRAVVAIGYPSTAEDANSIDGRAAADQAEAAEATGLGATWMKLMAGGRPPEEEVDRVRRLVDALGPGRHVAVDVNAGWPVGTALAMLPRLREAGAAFVEEPWPYELGLAGFAALDGVPHPDLAFGEVSSAVVELEALAGTGQVRYLRADATLLGGPAPFARVLPAAARHGCVLLPHFWPEVHRHLVAGYPGPAMVECVLGATGGFGLDRFVDGTVEVRDGVVVGPDRPGFGYRLDWAGIQYLAGGVPPTLTSGGQP